MAPCASSSVPHKDPEESELKVSGENELVLVPTSGWSKETLETVIAELTLRQMQFSVRTNEIQVPTLASGLILGLVSECMGSSAERNASRTGKGPFSFESARGIADQARSVLNRPKSVLLVNNIKKNWIPIVAVAAVLVVVGVLVVRAQFFPRYNAEFSNCRFGSDSPNTVFCEFWAENKTFDDRVFGIKYRIRNSAGEWDEGYKEFLVPARDKAVNPEVEMGWFMWAGGSVTPSISSISVR
jgi:hypothetical protein